MAKMTTHWREDDTEDHLVNGRSGVGALKLREPGFVDATKKFYFVTEGGQLRTWPSEQFLALAAAAASIGIVTPSGMAADNVQEALDELAAAVAGAGGGTIGGSAAAGSIPLMATINSVAASILSQDGGKIKVSGDALATLFLLAAGIIATDGTFAAGGDLSADGDVLAGGNLVGVRLVCDSVATSLLEHSGSTLTLGSAHTVVLTHATPTVTLPLADSVPPGTEYVLYFKVATEYTLVLSGSDIWKGLTHDLGLGIEENHVSLGGPASRILVKSNGGDTWYTDWGT